MKQMIFVNLPVSDVQKSKAFYNGLGFPTNPLFENEKASNAMISDEIMVMLLSKPFFESFIDREIADTRKTVGVLLAFSRESRAAVDEITEKALSLGGAERGPVQDLDFMYSRSFSDPDGNTWEPAWMDPAAMEGGPPQS